MITPEMKERAASILRSYGVDDVAYDLGHEILARCLPLSPSRLSSNDEGVTAFAKWVIQNSAFEGGDLSGDWVQDKAEEFGLIRETTYDPERHGPTDICEKGDMWFEFTEALSTKPEAGKVDHEAPPFDFDRYINGRLMAEGVCIERAATLEKAMVKASSLASRGPNGEAPVLVYRPRTQPTTPASGDEMEVVADEMPGERDILLSALRIDDDPNNELRLDRLSIILAKKDDDYAAANERANRLEREIEQLTKEIDCLVADAQSTWAKHGGTEIALGQWKYRAETAEALNTTLSEALSVARQHLISITGGDTSMVPQADQDQIDTALAALPAKQGGQS